MITKTGIAIVVFLLAGFGAVHAADAPVQLKPSTAIAPDIEAFPRLVAAPGDNAAVRINQALDRRDAVVKKAAKDCRKQSDRPAEADWSRSITVTMRGPAYISFTANDSWFCGGAHPDSSAMALVYDLQTGAPVNWARLLPAALVKGTSLDNAGDGTSIGLVSSPVLQDLMVKAEMADAANPLDPDCKDVVSDPEVKLSLWPDAKAGGLAVQPASLIHAVAACGDSVVIPTATLRKLGVSAALLDAIDVAHTAGFYDRDQP